MKARHVLWAAPVVAASLVLAGCAGSDGDSPSEGGGNGETLRIAGVYENTSDAFWGSFICGGMDRAEELGIDLEVSSIPTADNAKLATTLDTALLTNPDGVVFNQTDPAPWGTKVSSLMAEGIPVVTSNTALEGDLTYVTATQDASEFADDVAGIITDLAGSAVIVQGLADATWQHDRTDAIQEALTEANPDLTWLDTQVTGFDVNKGTQLISSLIAANPELKLILAASGPEGQAAAAAVEQTGATDIEIIAFDSVPAEIEALREGTISLIIAQPAYLLGGEMVQTMYDFLTSDDYVKGDAVVADSIDPVTAPLGMITAENVDSEESKAYIYSSECN